MIPMASNPATWRNQASCLGDDPNRWIRRHRGGNQDPLRRICATCPVRTDCLAHALAYNEPVGIWGGTSERERRLIKRALHAAAAGLIGTDHPPLPGFPPAPRPKRRPHDQHVARAARRPAPRFDGQLTLPFPPHPAAAPSPQEAAA